jgi:orotate phosphoribosyltransferase
MAAIFTYGFDLSVENFKNAKCDLVTLSNYDNLIEQAMDTGYVSNKEVDALKKWRIAPDKWPNCETLISCAVSLLVKLSLN